MRIIAAICLLLSASPLMAADFVFTVPVKLDKIPKGIPQAKVICEVFTYRDTHNPVASGYTIKAINSQQGFLYQDVTVEANFHNLQQHMKPHQYQCKLLLLVPWTQPSWQRPGEHAAVTALRPKPDSQLTSVVSGLITH